MKVNIAKISGLDDAMVALLYSKRTVTPEMVKRTRALVAQCTDENGFLRPFNTVDERLRVAFVDLVDKLMKYGVGHGHATLLSFIDITVEIWGLHRAGQDDWDAHAYRFHNRIVRNSTRLAKFEGNEKSGYYADKVRTTDEIIQEESLPPTIMNKQTGQIFVRVAGLGYVLQGHEKDQDIIRGMYRLMIPCNSITKVDYRQLRHIYSVRNAQGHAHPEVQKVAELIRAELMSKMPMLGEMLGKVAGSGLVEFDDDSFTIESGYVEKTESVTISKDLYDTLLAQGAEIDE